MTGKILRLLTVRSFEQGHAEVDVTEGVAQDVARGFERIAAHGWE